MTTKNTKEDFNITEYYFPWLKNRNTQDTSWNQMLKGVTLDMASRTADPNQKQINQIKEFLSSPNISNDFLTNYIKEKGATWLLDYLDFKGGKFDHKAPGKIVADSFYHNKDKNHKGKPAAVFGFKMPGDDSHIYDHDFWGNISYGYTLRAQKRSQPEIRAAAITDDLQQTISNKNGNFDVGDDPAVKFGIYIYDKYGSNITPEILEKEIIKKKDIFRRYKMDELSDRRIETKPGDTLEAIAEKYKVSPQMILEKNPDSNIYAQQDLKGGLKPLLPDPDEINDYHRTLAAQAQTKQTFLPNSAKMVPGDIPAARSGADESAVKGTQGSDGAGVKTAIGANGAGAGNIGVNGAGAGNIGANGASVDAGGAPGAAGKEAPVNGNTNVNAAGVSKDGRPDMSAVLDSTPLPLADDSMYESKNESVSPSNEGSQEQEAKNRQAAAQKLMKNFEKYADPYDNVLYKNPADITEDEMKQAMRYADYGTADPEIKKALNDKADKWYAAAYGQQPVAYDASGKMIRPEQAAPKQSAGKQESFGNSFIQTLSEISEKAVDFGVQSLQKGLNALYFDTPNIPLKIDGFLGPKTARRVKQSLYDFGKEAVKKSVGFGAFSSLMENNREKKVSQTDLDKTVRSMDPEQGPKKLQKGLNRLGTEKPDFMGLKEDNQIGPKTTDTFNKLKDEKEDDIKSMFSSSLW